MMLINHIESSFRIARMVDTLPFDIEHAWLIMRSKLFFEQFQIFTMALSENVISGLLNLGSMKVIDIKLASVLCESETNSVWTCFAMFCLASFASAWSELCSCFWLA